MRVTIIIDETSFFHPIFVTNLIKRFNDMNFLIQGVIVKKIPEKNSLEKYMIKNFYYLKVTELIKLLFLKIKYFFLNIIFAKGFNRKYFSVESTFKNFSINYFNVKLDINNIRYLKIIKSFKPHFIISSNSLYFKKKLLNIPRYACLNRHTSLLPSYGGLWPVFYAIANNEKYYGVSVHSMSKKIDSGKIYSQKKMKLNEKNLYKLYNNSFLVSDKVIIDAINNFKKKKFFFPNYKSSYFSFPKKKDWKKFRKNGGKFI